MKHLYNGVAKLLQTTVPELVWIDQDTGQLEYYTLRPGLDFPAVLIDVSYPQCENIGSGGSQRCTAEIKLRVVFEVWSESNMGAPETVRELALSFYDVLSRIKENLHNCKLETGETLYRTSVLPEKREDGLKVFNITFRTKTTE